MQHVVWAFRFCVTNTSILRRSSGGNFSIAEAPAEAGLTFWEKPQCREEIEDMIFDEV